MFVDRSRAMSIESVRGLLGRLNTENPVRSQSNGFIECRCLSASQGLSEGDCAQRVVELSARMSCNPLHFILE